jgi:hypothetical protein
MWSRVLFALLTAAALATGCVKENELFGEDAGADADTDADTDTDTDTDADTDTCQDQAYLACHLGDVCWFDSCDEPGEPFDECADDEICQSTSDVMAQCCLAHALQQCDADGDVIWIDSCGFDGNVVDDCHDTQGACIDLTPTEAECACADHWDIATECESCEEFWDAATDCTACVYGHGGASCAVCEIGYEGVDCLECAVGYYAPEDVCEYNALCGTDWIWLVEGALPAAERSASEFEIGGTVAEPTIQDTITGLEWRQCVAGKSWNGTGCEGSATSVAADTLATLCTDTYGGVTDWRVPDVTELATLLHHAEPPMILDDVFHDIGQPTIWTADSCPLADTDNWAVQFFDGTVTGVSFESQVLCVSGGLSAPDPLPARFTVAAADGSTVRDDWTGLEWHRCLAGEVWDGDECAGLPAAYDWDTAQLACDGTYAGHDDWTLPDVVQLRSTINFCAQSPASFAAAFPGPLDDMIWSSTGNSTLSIAWYVNWVFGESGTASFDSLYRVRCVRPAD